MRREPSVSVVIPVKDGERYLAEVLAALARQAVAHDVLVIDSGSSDGSPAIARAAGARIHEIAPHEFGHGRTRNLGAELTDGEIICFLTQDATPDDGWLAALVEPFATDERVGVVFGPQLPRPGTSPMVARELTQVFARLAHDDVYISNVNAAYRRACWQEIRFRDVAYAEDQAFGRDLQDTEWIKVFAPAAGVHHAHDYGLVASWRRSFDEARGLRDATGWVETFAPRASLGGIRRQVGRDVRWMRRERRPLPGALAWTARSAAYHSGRKAFAWLGSRAERLPARLRRALSLEGRS